MIESENSDLEKEEIEAKYIADKIHDMINSGFRVKDGDIMREARYGYFAIILRSPSGKAATYVNTRTTAVFLPIVRISQVFLMQLKSKLCSTFCV